MWKLILSVVCVLGFSVYCFHLTEQSINTELHQEVISLKEEIEHLKTKNVTTENAFTKERNRIVTDLKKTGMKDTLVDHIVLGVGKIDPKTGEIVLTEGTTPEKQTKE